VLDRRYALISDLTPVQIGPPKSLQQPAGFSDSADSGARFRALESENSSNGLEKERIIRLTLTDFGPILSSESDQTGWISAFSESRTPFLYLSLSL
jgi:hypothetical protein